MKAKTVSITDDYFFCPNCHMRIKLPFEKGQVKIESSMVLNCSGCKQGKIIVKGNKVLEKE